jgi:hypothetical protein
MKPEYYPRLIKPFILTAMADTPVVCLLGPRQVGKTTLAQQLEANRAYIDLDDFALLEAAKQDPAGFIRALPDRVTIDEVQRAPELMIAIKSAVDKDRRPGRFLLTSSANLLLLPGIQESLAGRVEILQLYPLSEREKQLGKNHFLEQLVTGQLIPQITGQQSVIEGIADAVCQGGYPEPLLRSATRARQWHWQYLHAMIERDVKDIANIRDEGELIRLIELLAHRTASLLNVTSLANELGVRRETTENYLRILERLFLIRRLPAWHKNQAKRLIKTPKIHLLDSGIVASLRGLTAEDWHQHSADFGGVLESFVVQQIICQASWLEAEFRFYHYRDKDNIEVDLVIESGRKIWGVEVKKSASIQSKDGVGLARLAVSVTKSAYWKQN